MVARGTNTETGKYCKACGIFKPITEFFRNHTYTEGYDSKCKDCKRRYQAGWREEHREEHRAYSREYHHEHRAERLTYHAAWLSENKQYKATLDKNWRRNHPERLKAANARRRARIFQSAGRFSTREWNSLKVHYGGKCLKCGRAEPLIKLTPDHIIPLSQGGNNSIENIQPLCWGCNATKGAKVADYRHIQTCEDYLATSPFGAAGGQG